MALGGVLGLGLVARDAAALCVAGAAQTHIYRRFAWQAWHKLTSTIVWRGRRGIHGTVSSAWDGLVVSCGRRGTISHTIFHTQLCHTPSTPSFTHNFVTHHLSHTALSHTTLSHTTFSHTTPLQPQLQPQLQLVSQVRLVICIQRCGHTHHLSHTTLSHTTPLPPPLHILHFVWHVQLLPSFGLFHFHSHYWKKLTCGVIRSFNFVWGP